ncbi:MAG TPA: hypothetical protein VH969_11285 [Actinophytocola sp.]|uniref:hypothetical protein n=1 Tax=Actinophytocola sp. TaxID=1872138 RepID=UPI002F95CF43
MTDEDVPDRDEQTATDLLDDMRTLRARVRTDRHGFAFPLFLFGALILLAPLTYVSTPLDPGVTFEMVQRGPFPQFAPMFGNVKYPGVIDWYWVLTIVGGMALTGWWYRRRALRLGVETDTRTPFVAAGAALAGFLLWEPLLNGLLTEYGTLYSSPKINLPILVVSAVAATAVLAWAFRPQRTDTQRAAGVFAGILLASLTFATVGIYMIKGFSALLAIAAALLVLAWWERSALLAVVGVLFTAASIPANHPLWYWDLGYVFQELGWTTSWDDGTVFALQNLLLPGLILLAGGAVAALTRHGAAPRE